MGAHSFLFLLFGSSFSHPFSFVSHFFSLSSFSFEVASLILGLLGTRVRKLLSVERFAPSPSAFGPSALHCTWGDRGGGDECARPYHVRSRGGAGGLRLDMRPFVDAALDFLGVVVPAPEKQELDGLVSEWTVLECRTSRATPAEKRASLAVRVLLFAVTFHANRAHNLTRSP